MITSALLSAKIFSFLFLAFCADLVIVATGSGLMPAWRLTLANWALGSGLCPFLALRRFHARLFNVSSCDSRYFLRAYALFSSCFQCSAIFEFQRVCRDAILDINFSIYVPFFRVEKFQFTTFLLTFMFRVLYCETLLTLLISRMLLYDMCSTLEISSVYLNFMFRRHFV